MRILFLLNFLVLSLLAQMDSLYSDDYQLQIGDRLRISVYPEDDCERVVTVDGFGHVQYLLLGSIPAAGRSIDALRSELNEKIKEISRYGIVSIVPESFESQYFTVFGEVKAPGVKSLQGKTMLSEAISRCGGSKYTSFRGKIVEITDLRHAFVARGGELLNVNIYDLVVLGDMSQDIEIIDGDSIFIPNNLSRRVHVLGEVHCSGAYDYKHNMTLGKAIALAGGVSREYAPDWAYIHRGLGMNKEQIVINLQDLFNGRMSDYPLQPNDIVFMPKKSVFSPDEVEKLAMQSFVGAASFANFISEATDDQEMHQIKKLF
jgi:polysaccharide export outer membrane protein